MELVITNRNLELHGDEKEILQDRFSKISQKFQLKLNNISVVLEKRKYIHYAEVIVHGAGINCFGEAESDQNVYVAIDEAATKVETQLKKFKDKTKSHKVKSQEDAFVEEEQPESSSKGLQAAFEKIEIEKKVIQPMSIEEAALQMELVLQEKFLLFLNSKTDEVNLIYRKNDGQYGVIQQDK